jgi:hypothetical protein
MNSGKKSKKKNSSDLLTDHDEWIQHMYSPGYYINRVSWATKAQWYWMRSHPKISGALLAILSGIGLFAIGYATISDFIDQPGSLLPVVVILVASTPAIIIFIAGVILFLKTPEHLKNNKESQPKKSEKHTKQVKHRKDYH